MISEAKGWPKVRDLFRAAGGGAWRVEAGRTAGVPDVTWVMRGDGHRDASAGFLELKKVEGRKDETIVLSAVHPLQDVWMRNYAKAGGRVGVCAVLPSLQVPRHAWGVVLVPWSAKGSVGWGRVLPLKGATGLFHAAVSGLHYPMPLDPISEDWKPVRFRTVRATVAV